MTKIWQNAHFLKCIFNEFFSREGKMKKTKIIKVETATFGAGCFWHVEEEFRKVPGVLRATVGYMGGTLEDPAYNDVSTGKTGHAEVCQIEFDRSMISYAQLLEKFWKLHDPTQLDRQGPDMGSQYRSVIFYHNERQRQAAGKSKDAQQQKLSSIVVTQIKKAGKFYRAEEYHQEYLEKKGLHAC
jgi:peptide-methionine (S)-S-oxide reductase